MLKLRGATFLLSYILHPTCMYVCMYVGAYIELCRAVAIYYAYTYISRPHSLCANTVGFGIFPPFCELFVQRAKISSLWGAYVYIF